MKIVGFNQGQIGDLAINIIAARAIKERYPDSHLIFSINKKYESCAPIFYFNPLIDEIVIWDGYDEWPTKKDEEILKEINPDLFFHPCPKNKDEQWFFKMHHTEANCINNGLVPPSNLKVTLNKYFEVNPIYKNCIAIAPFTSAGAVRDIPEEVSIKIIEYIHSLGYQTIQLGLKSHKQLNTTFPITGKSIFEDVKIAVSCRLLVTADTGINYIMSGYSHKVLGLYSLINYPMAVPLKNRTPINENAIFLEGLNISDIPIHSIFNSIRLLSNE